MLFILFALGRRLVYMWFIWQREFNFVFSFLIFQAKRICWTAPLYHHAYDARYHWMRLFQRNRPMSPLKRYVFSWTYIYRMRLINYELHHICPSSSFFFSPSLWETVSVSQDSWRNHPLSNFWEVLIMIGFISLLFFSLCQSLGETCDMRLISENFIFGILPC